MRHDGGDAHRADGHEHDARRDVAVDAYVKDVGVDSFVCESTYDPAMQPCVVADEYGVFVAPAANGGDDGNGGTKSAPFATIGHAIGVVTGGGMMAGKRVYVCGATYAESLSVTKTVAVYGGFACPEQDAGHGHAAWSYTGDKPVVYPASAGFALDVSGVSGAQFQDIAFEARPAPGALVDGGVADAGGGPAQSSIAVMVSDSSGVSFTRVGATAGAGAPGLSAAPAASNWCPMVPDAGAPSPDGGPTAPNGVPAADAGPGLGAGSFVVGCVCAVSGSSKGGAGGAAGFSGDPGSSVPPIAEDGGSGGIEGPACGDGVNGNNGLAGGAGTPGGAGSLGVSGWTVVGGSGGTIANPGQGGGGGAGNQHLGGAGGGAGGCGGSGGAAGSGGGASIAIAVVGSSLEMGSVTVKTAAGGAGGSGAAGEPGQAGGMGGSDGLTGECLGGQGGAGGGGGGGGGSPGGPSVGIAWTGSTTIIVDGRTVSVSDAGTLGGPSVFQIGSGGAAGAGGAGGGSAGNPGPAGGNGPPGVSGDVVSL
jgi:hypothetical protein